MKRHNATLVAMLGLEEQLHEELDERVFEQAHQPTGSQDSACCHHPHRRALPPHMLPKCWTGWEVGSDPGDSES